MKFREKECSVLCRISSHMRRLMRETSSPGPLGLIIEIKDVEVMRFGSFIVKRTPVNV